MRYLISSPARRTLVLLAGIVSVSGCATKQDIRDLQTDLASELRRIAATQDSLREEIRRQSLQTQDTLRNANRELVDIRGDVLTTLNRIGSQLGQIQELVGQNSLSITSLRDEVDALRRSGGVPAGVEGEPIDIGAMPITLGSGEADAKYSAAMRQYSRGSNTAAKAAFEEFITSFPSHELTPQAHYYLADILAQEEDLEGAIDAFEQIPELFPLSESVPTALYRIGVLHIELGNEDEARLVLERVINTYPEHRIAEDARARLAEIGGDRP
jgi:tol-pal system protein YbgF